MMGNEIPLKTAALFSGHVHHVCRNADKIYTSEDIIKAIGEGKNTKNDAFLLWLTVFTVNIDLNTFLPVF